MASSGVLPGPRPLADLRLGITFNEKTLGHGRGLELAIDGFEVGEAGVSAKALAGETTGKPWSPWIPESVGKIGHYCMRVRNRSTDT